MHLLFKLLFVPAQLSEAVPVPGSGLSLPLDLQLIASRCTGSYYAPSKFSAVQLAFSEPRCRILIFHTGRVVGTGCSGILAARLALLKAQREMYNVGVYVDICNFSVSRLLTLARLLVPPPSELCDARPLTHQGYQYRGRVEPRSNNQL